MKTGTLYGIGVGPGDPELLTVKAARLIAQTSIIAYHAAQHGRSNARKIAEHLLTGEKHELALLYPVTTESRRPAEGYEAAMRAFYDESAAKIAEYLDAGQDVALLCEGDPLFYGSYMYVHDRLREKYPVEIVPGICSLTGAAARLGAPLVRRDTPLTILPGTLSEDDLTDRMRAGDAYAVLKLGRNFAKVRRALDRAGILDRALYIERATMHGERMLPICEVDENHVPYFSLILVPSALNAPLPRDLRADGRLSIIGLGPGGPHWRSPEAREALSLATHLVGYQTYLDRVPVTPGQIRLGSDNRVEIDRARHALELAAAGNNVCVVSSGDPGIFAMASAVMEAVEHGDAAWRDIDIHVLPGISAMQAAAARVGAPLGHDFCVISLSDRLKPWEIIARRLDAAAAADFAIAIYNPVSSQRTRQIHDAQEIVSRHRHAATPVILARDVGGSGERIIQTSVADFANEPVDMRTLVIIGSSMTRRISRTNAAPFVYTPRSYGTERAHG